MIDELDAISLRLRCRNQPIEHPDDTDTAERSYIGVCMKCENFPIDPVAACPNCQTGRWVTTVRS